MLLLTALQVITLGRDLPGISPVPAPQAGTPHLTHSAPFVGQTLSIQVGGAPANARVDLFLSPSAGTCATPYGDFELACSDLHEVASGVTSATGTWSVEFPIPLDAALAETEQHFQAIVDDPSGPTGRVLSDAIHMRLLGPRMYAGYSGGLEIYSTLSETVVMHVDFAGGFDSKPIFDSSYSRGAVMSSPRELLFFDPYFGGGQATIPFASDCSGSLIMDSAHHTVYVLESGAAETSRIHAIRLSDGIETSHLDLPNPIAGLWCEGSAGVEAWVAEYELDGQTSIRRVALDPFADLGSAIVGNPNNQGAGFEDLIYSADQLFVSTLEPDVDPRSPYRNGCLTRCSVVGSSIVTQRENLLRGRLFRMTAVPDADWVVAQIMSTFGPGFGMCRFPLSKPGPIEGLPGGAPYLPEYAVCIVADGMSAWIVGLEEFGEGSSRLHRLDFSTNTWTLYPVHWYPGGVVSAAALVRDALDHELWVANRAFPPFGTRSKITIVDELRGTTRNIPLTYAVEALYGAPIP